MPQTLQQRIDACLEKGALSVADIALWLDLPYPTVKSYRQGTTPQAARQRQIEQRLSWLESAIRTDPRLPVPLSVRARERKAYLMGVFAGVSRKRK